MTNLTRLLCLIQQHLRLPEEDPIERRLDQFTLYSLVDHHLHHRQILGQSRVTVGLSKKSVRSSRKNLITLFRNDHMRSCVSQDITPMTQFS